ncbi:D-alanine--D-alanine ligase [Nocardia cyriacigeorgica]|uniref:D-alanine--D-alanine ligase n=1 Tax=Nocardia cyriacigeorgica TaxID=135487 RepID=UPI00189516F8|nr:D-alanine--D-alanine ligase [Nocardia cyriacigeorgica]MBF6397893.1 D-alanine--D-alanine ligase [Nocardia cyriacigeorgica]MBF6402450.1 D-alanine--D-alanine ligase [Nocardia cyriacigeorgica]
MSKKMVVVFGGETPEHEVSLCGARSVLECAAELGWVVLPVGVTKSGQWVVGEGALERLWRAADQARFAKGVTCDDDVPGSGGRVRVFEGLPGAEVFTGYDLGFPVAHGRWAEDGTLQALLTAYGLAVVGCGVAPSAMSFDKQIAKSVLASAGLPVARGMKVEQRDYEQSPRSIISRVQEVVGPLPWFVKPARGGSSLGIGRVESSGELAAALGEAFRWDSAALVEEMVPHRELVLGVVGSPGSLLVSPAGECVPVGDLYTYEEKVRLGNPLFTCPAPIDPDVAKRAEELAVEAFRVLGCSVFARVDLFLDSRTGDLLINEVNTIPGMTEVSVFPKVMRAAGLGYPQLLTELTRITIGE